MEVLLLQGFLAFIMVGSIIINLIYKNTNYSLILKWLSKVNTYYKLIINA